MNKNIITLLPSYGCSEPVMPSSYSNNKPYFETKSQNKPFLLEAAFAGRLVTAVSSAPNTRCVETVDQGTVFSLLLI